ncbi:MAG: fluoride efflux transporter CrcB [Pirellulales bacterium]
MWKEWIAIALGGMVGTLLRHGLNCTFKSLHPQAVPLSTWIVNVVGCLAIGFTFKWAADRDLSGHWGELAVRVGLLGGLTTFSSFGFEVIRFWQSGKPGLGIAVIAAHVIIGLAAVALGITLAGKTA